MQMKPRQKYIPGSDMLLQRHVDFLHQYAEKHGIAINQAKRDAIQHALECPFFNGRHPNGGTTPPTEGAGK